MQVQPDQVLEVQAAVVRVELARMPQLALLILVAVEEEVVIQALKAVPVVQV